MVSNTRFDRVLRIVWSVLIVLVLATGVQAADDKAVVVKRVFLGDEPLAFVEDEFIVVLNREARTLMTVKSDARGLPVVSVPSLQAVIESSGVVNFARQFPTAQAYPEGSKYPDLTGHYKVQIAPGVDLDAAINAFNLEPNVEHTEKIGIHLVYGDPNDPYYKDSPNPGFNYDQWHYFDRNTPQHPNENFSIQADWAWYGETGSSSVVVAIADTGVRYYHGDLGGSDPPGPADNTTNGNVFVNPGEIPGNSLDDDGNGYVDDVVGYDFVTSASCIGGGCTACCDDDCATVDNDPHDHNGHGTHLSGTVAAITNNNTLVAGVAGGFSDGTSSGAGNGVRILPLRIGYNCICSGSCGWGKIRMDYAAAAFNYVAGLVDRGVNITAINCSWSSSNSGGLDAAVNAVQARDVLVVHAAGNDNSSAADYLGGKAGVLNVAATQRDGHGASFTNYGTWVDVAAPGVDILSTWHEYTDPGSDYIASVEGTSTAAPHVVGIAALLESWDPLLSATQKFNLIVGNTRPYIDVRNLGSGIANAYLALVAAGCAIITSPQPETPSTDKVRGISLVPGNAGKQTALRATLSDLPPPFEGYEGCKLWVGPPTDVSEVAGKDDATPPTFKQSRLQTSWHCMDWSTVGLVHVTGSEIVPLGVYNIQTIDCTADPSDEGNYSLPLVLDASKWGDIVGSSNDRPPNGSVDFVDISSVVDKFKNLPGAPIKSRADIAPQTPDKIVDFADIPSVVDAFRGRPYPYAGLEACTP